MVERINELLVRTTDPHMFVTFFYGVPQSDDITLVAMPRS